MQLFVGSFGSCTDPAILSHELCHAAPSAPPALPSSAPPSLSRQLSLDSGGGDGVWLGGGNGGNFGGDANYSVWLGGGADGGNYGGGNYDGSEGGSEGGGGGGGSGGSGGGGLRAWRRLKGGGGNGGAASGPAHWSNPPYGSFDDWGQSMLTLYVMSTGDGWDLVMFSGMDATQAGSAPAPALAPAPAPAPTLNLTLNLTLTRTRSRGRLARAGGVGGATRAASGPPSGRDPRLCPAPGEGSTTPPRSRCLLPLPIHGACRGGICCAPMARGVLVLGSDALSYEARAARAARAARRHTRPLTISCGCARQCRGGGRGQPGMVGRGLKCGGSEGGVGPLRVGRRGLGYIPQPTRIAHGWSSVCVCTGKCGMFMESNFQF